MNIFYDECRRKNFKDSLNSLCLPLNFGKPPSFPPNQLQEPLNLVCGHNLKVVIPRTVPRDKKIVFSTPLNEFWVYDQTVRDEKQVWHAFEVLQRICRFTFMND